MDTLPPTGCVPGPDAEADVEEGGARAEAEAPGTESPGNEVPGVESRGTEALKIEATGKEAFAVRHEKRTVFYKTITACLYSSMAQITYKEKRATLALAES